jgi:hypothetical protein
MCGAAVEQATYVRLLFEINLCIKGIMLAFNTCGQCVYHNLYDISQHHV